MRMRLVDGGTAQLPVTVWPELFLRKLAAANIRSQAREDGDTEYTCYSDWLYREEVKTKSQDATTENQYKAFR